MKKIAVVNSSSFTKHFPKHLKQLEKIGSVDFFNFHPKIESTSLVKYLEDYDYIISSVTPNFDEYFFNNTPKLKLLSRHGIGYNNIDVVAAKKNKVHVTIIEAEIERNAVAEATVALLLSLSRKIHLGHKLVLENKWEDRHLLMGFEFTNKTTGVIGFGNIGSRVGEIMQKGFSNIVYAYDPYLAEDKRNSYMSQGIIFKNSLEEILPKVDFLSINCNLTEENKHFINENMLKLMKPSALIVNTARGALISEKDLLKSIEGKNISGYAADVLETEPIAEDHPFLNNENILITPHLSAYTWKCLEDMGDKCVQDVIDVYEGRRPSTVVS